MFALKCALFLALQQGHHHGQGPCGGTNAPEDMEAFQPQDQCCCTAMPRFVSGQDCPRSLSPAWPRWLCHSHSQRLMSFSPTVAGGLPRLPCHVLGQQVPELCTGRRDSLSSSCTECAPTGSLGSTTPGSSKFPFYFILPMCSLKDTEGTNFMIQLPRQSFAALSPLRSSRQEHCREGAPA